MLFLWVIKRQNAKETEFNICVSGQSHEQQCYIMPNLITIFILKQFYYLG